MILSTRAMLLMGLVFTLAVLFLGAHLSYLAAAVDTLAASGVRFGLEFGRVCISPWTADR